MAQLDDTVEADGGPIFHEARGDMPEGEAAERHIVRRDHNDFWFPADEHRARIAHDGDRHDHVDDRLGVGTSPDRDPPTGCHPRQRLREGAHRASRIDHHHRLGSDDVGRDRQEPGEEVVTNEGDRSQGVASLRRLARGGEHSGPVEQGAAERSVQAVAGGARAPPRGCWTSGAYRIGAEEDGVLRSDERAGMPEVGDPRRVDLLGLNGTADGKGSQATDVVEGVDLAGAGHQFRGEALVHDRHVAVVAGRLAEGNGCRTGGGACQRGRTKQRGRIPTKARAAHACAAMGDRHDRMARTATRVTAAMSTQPPDAGQLVAWKLSNCLLPMSGG